MGYTMHVSDWYLVLHWGDQLQWASLSSTSLRFHLSCVFIFNKDYTATPRINGCKYFRKVNGKDFWCFTRYEIGNWPQITIYFTTSLLQIWWFYLQDPKPALDVHVVKPVIKEIFFSQMGTHCKKIVFKAFWHGYCRRKNDWFRPQTLSSSYRTKVNYPFFDGKFDCRG